MPGARSRPFDRLEYALPRGDGGIFRGWTGLDIPLRQQCGDKLSGHECCGFFIDSQVESPVRVDTHRLAEAGGESIAPGGGVFTPSGASA